jgi:hypothetical protein
MKIRQVGAEFYVDGWMVRRAGRMTLIVDFHNFSNMPKIVLTYHFQSPSHLMLNNIMSVDRF